MNSISLISVAELLDGRYFFIPAYQRGYRWGKAQMWELLDDLYEFAIRKKAHGEFYCLQPVIVQPIVSDKKLTDIREITGWGESVNSDNTWEVVVSGYQPLDKWLKDRNGIRLSSDDIRHYQKMVVALTKTIDIVSQLDASLQL